MWTKEEAFFSPLTAEVIRHLRNYDKKHKGTPEFMKMWIVLH